MINRQEVQKLNNEDDFILDKLGDNLGARSLDVQFNLTAFKTDLI